MKNEFKNQDLNEYLDQFEVDIPKVPFKQKRSSWERLIHYLLSPADNPIEKLVELFGAKGYIVFPSIVVLIVTLTQFIY